MKSVLVLLLSVGLCAPRLAAQTPPAKNEPAKAAPGQKSPANPPPAAAHSNADLEKVLSAMDRTADGFHSAQADFVWDQYEAVVKETSTQKGVMYLRRAKDFEMAAKVEQPAEEQKYVLYAGGKVQLYQPKMDQITEYQAGRNREAFQSFLVLGFGGRGHDLSKQFEVKYAGDEMAQGVKAAKLELTPRAPRVRSMFNLIVLWIDPARGVSVQQKFIEPESGNYRLARYSNIKLNAKVPDGAFRLPTTGKTKTVPAGL